MERENRYLVLKRADIDMCFTPAERNILFELVQRLADYREDCGLIPRPCFVCVKEGWPEYELTWAAIEKRVDAEAHKQSNEDK